MSNNDITQNLEQQTPPVSDDWLARREAATAARSLIEHLTTTTSDASVLRAVAAVLREQTKRMAEAVQLPGRKGFLEFDNGRLGNYTSINIERNPVTGKCNPLAPPLDYWFEDDTAHGRVKLGWQYEGPPAMVHGGFICALFDDFLGMTQTLTGQPGFTGTLTTSFHRPTPLHTELKLIGRIVEVSGRKNIVSGEMWVNGNMTASCQGVYIRISKERDKQMAEACGE